MSIYARCMGIEQPQMSSHHLTGAVAEYARGQITAQQAADFLQLSAAEVDQVTELKNRVTGGFLTRNEVDDVLMMAAGQESDYNPYLTEAAVKTRFGVTL